MRVRRAEAARELGLNRSTVTRIVQDHPALVDEYGLVDLEALRVLRADVINPNLQTRGPGAPSAMDARMHGRGGPDDSPRGGLNATRERTEAAKAETAELDLAERLGLTLRREDVEAAVAAAGDLMRQEAFTLARDQAERLARIDDVRVMERALEDLMRAVLTKAAGALALAAAPADLAQAS